MKAGLVAAGAILIVLGIIAYVYPITSVGSFSDVNDLCNSAIGTFGKVLSAQVRENCQTAKYLVLGSYAFMGIGALLVIVGSVTRGNTSSIPQQSESMTPQAKRTIVIGIGIAAAIALGVFVYQISLQPNIQVSNLNIATNHNNQFVKVYDQGRVSNSGNFYYSSPQSSSYYLVFSNDFSIISTKHISMAYTDKGQTHAQNFQVAPGTYESIPVYVYSGQAISGSFNVAGGSGNDVDFYIATNTCSETVSFSFNLSNNSPVNGNADISLKSDGNIIWSNIYYVESQKQVSESGSATIKDCDQHDFKMIVTSQKRIG